MKHIIGFSGGAASAVAAKIVRDQHPGEEVILLFHDTRTEPADNDRFRADVAQYLDLPITDDSDGRDIWQVFDDEGFLGNHLMTPCSRHLKQERGNRFLMANQPCVFYLGYTVEEWQRGQRTYARFASLGIDVRYPLIEEKITKEQCLDRVTKCWGLQLPEMYSWANHANCIPCVKGGMAYWGCIAYFYPDIFSKACEYEKKYASHIMKDGFLLEKKSRCIELAKELLSKKDGERKQVRLFEFPCECAV
jgi:hypothetical protein